jgi:hypothetical protein
MTERDITDYSYADLVQGSGNDSGVPVVERLHIVVRDDSKFPSAEQFPLASELNDLREYAVRQLIETHREEYEQLMAEEWDRRRARWARGRAQVTS